MNFINFIFLLLGLCISALLLGSITNDNDQEGLGSIIKRGLSILLILFLLISFGFYVVQSPEILIQILQELKNFVTS